jgi:hypothetical protein
LQIIFRESSDYYYGRVKHLPGHFSLLKFTSGQTALVLLEFAAVSEYPSLRRSDTPQDQIQAISPEGGQIFQPGCLQSLPSVYLNFTLIR